MIVDSFCFVCVGKLRLHGIHRHTRKIQSFTNTIEQNQLKEGPMFHCLVTELVV
jgi:hypothetical protein